MRLELTANFRADPDGGYHADVSEIGGVHAQGADLEEARKNLEDAVRQLIAERRAERMNRSDVVIEPLIIDIAAS